MHRREEIVKDIEALKRKDPSIYVTGEDMLFIVNSLMGNNSKAKDDEAVLKNASESSDSEECGEAVWFENIAYQENGEEIE